MKTRATYFPNLDGLRTVACLGVFLFHTLYLYAYLWTPHDAPVFRYGLRLLSVGAQGVSLFFVLSGFLITYLLLQEEAEQGQVSIRGFYLRRVLRIWPLYFACMAFGFVVVPWYMHLTGQPWHETADPGMYALFLANLDAFRHANAVPATFNLAVLWSVSVEEQFYLVWPVLLMVLFRWWRPGAFLLIIGVSLWFRYTHATDDARLFAHTLSVAGDLAVGGLAGWASFRYAGFRAWLGRWPRWAVPAVYVALFALMAGQHALGSHPLNVAVERLVRSAFFAFIVLEQNYAAHSPFKLGRSRWLTYWGTFTYGFYCLHPIVIMVVSEAITRLHLPTQLPTVIGLALVSLPLSAGLAWLSYQYLERPFLKLKTRRLAAPGVSSSQTQEVREAVVNG
ncbi:acyltransferase family protein [Hymenobacter jeollabukensis]|nr:acyltransferase [Hymenobacter jeollabukensis]